MGYSLLIRAFVGAVSAVTAATLIYVYAFPPPSVQVSRDGVPYFTPPVINPETGEEIKVDVLVRHFKGE